MIIKTILLLLICVFLYIPELNAHSPRTDLKLRLSSSVKKKLSDRVNVDLEYEYRLNNKLSTMDKTFLEPSLSYRINKQFRLSGLYRISYDQNSVRAKELEHRLAGFLRYSSKWQDFELKVKSGVQYDTDNLSRWAFSYTNRWINRNSFEIEYDWFGTRITPSAAYEFFYNINHLNGGIINQSRTKLAIAYELSNKIDFDLFYMFENEFNVVIPVDANIVGFNMTYTL